MKNYHAVRTVFLACGVTALCSSNAFAFAHLWELSELFSSADGQVQFIEFTNATAGSSEIFLSGSTVTITETAPPNTVHTFTFPGNLSGSTAFKTFLMATPGFSSLPGGVTPDYTIPTGFLFTAGATFVFSANGHSVVYTNLFLDGVSSIDHDGEPAVNTPRNFAGAQGSVNVSPPPMASDTNNPINLLMVNQTGVTLSWVSTNSAKYDLLFSPNIEGINPVSSIAEPNIKPGTNGVFTYDDPPLLASPLFDKNVNGFYALGVRSNDQPQIHVLLSVVASNFVAPVVLTHAGDGSDRLFVADQPGRIWIITNSNVLPTPFLDISSQIVSLNPAYDERGLLGLAFHPQYSVNGRFFVYYSAPKSGTNINHESIVAEYHVSATNINMADPSGTIVLRLDEPQSNHNGGALAFGPDGYLYISLGDGGGQGDPTPSHGPSGNGQNTDSLLGSILRIDIDGAPPYQIPPDNPFVGTNGLDEIYAYGLRNPFRISFDRGGSNELFVADVGQNFYEEINIVKKGDNCGWRIIEGRHAFDLPLAGTLGIDVVNLAYPIHEYNHNLGISVIGGYVYRGTNYNSLVGSYVFGDFSTTFGAPDGQLFYLTESRPDIWERTKFYLSPTNAPLGRFVKGFGEDERGDIYLLSTTNLGPSGTSGDIRRLGPPP